MDLKYDLNNYIASVKMSSKKRLLVEGRDDKAHINNLLDVTLSGHKIKIDTAENIKGDCASTGKNNRAKIEKIHGLTKISNGHGNLYFLCDREFRNFDVTNKVTDLMNAHESDGNLSWTLGHSLENYFIKDDLVCDAYRFLCGSEYKNKAENLFRTIFSSSLKIIAAATLAAKDIDKCSYPAGVIFWQDIIVGDDNIFINMEDWEQKQATQVATDFHNEYKKYLPIVECSDDLICSRICRGHTAMILLQRAFAACLHRIATTDSDESADRIANEFSHIRERSISSALCESWVRSVRKGEAAYPNDLVNAVS